MASSDDQARFSFSNSQIQSEIPFFSSPIHLVFLASTAPHGGGSSGQLAGWLDNEHIVSIHLNKKTISTIHLPPWQGSKPT